MTLRLVGDVADVRLANPRRGNALDGAMFVGLAEALSHLRAGSVRAVVLSGDGRNFCAGLDKAMFDQILAGKRAEGIPADLVERTHGNSNLPQHVVMGWRALDVPVIAAINGAALGGGLQLALGADLRIAAPAARLGLLEVRWGLVPDMGAFALLPSLVREDVAHDLIFRAREICGTEAVQLGLATRLANDPYRLALDIAQDIARGSPPAIGAAKRLANKAFDAAAAILLRESAEQQALIGSDDQRAVLAAALRPAPRDESS